MKKVKILLSIICAVACFLSCAFVPSAVSTVSAADTPTPLTEIYPSDFGIDDGIYATKRANNCKVADSLLGTIFTMDFRFVSGNELRLQYASPDSEWRGLSFRFNKQAGTLVLRDDTGNYLTKQVDFDSETAGVDLLNDTVRIQISLEAVDNDGLGEENDLKIGVFFNYRLYGGEYIYQNDTALNLGNLLAIHTDFSDVLSTYEISSPKDEDSEYYLETTPADFGIRDGTVDTAVTTDLGLDGKSFNLNVDLQTGDYIDYRGIKIQRENTGALMVSDSTGNNSFSSVTTESPKAIEAADISVLTKIVAENTLKATVFVDGTAIAEPTIYNYKNVLTNSIAIKANIKSPEKQLSYKSEVVSFDKLGLDGGFKASAEDSYKFSLNGEKVISGYVTPENAGNVGVELVKDNATVLTLSEFSVADGSYNNENAATGSYQDGVLDTFFSAKLKYATVAPVFYYGGATKNTGIKFKLSALNKIGVYGFDGTLITSITASNAGVGSSFNNKEFLLGIAMGAADTDSDGQNDDIKLALWFNGVYYSTYNLKDAAKDAGGYITLTSANTNKLTASSCYSEPDAENMPYDLSNRYTEVLNYSINKESAFDLSITPVCLDDDGIKNDASVIYFQDGSAVNNRQYFINNCLSDKKAATIVANVTVENATVYDRLPEDDLEEANVYNLHEAPYLLMGVGEIYVNREGGHYAGEVIETAGEYVIVRNFLGKEYVEKVALWRYGNADGRAELNILDYVAAQRYIVSESNSSLARKGADLDLDGKLTSKDMILLKRILLGIDTLKEYTYESDKWSFEDDVMPIVGYNGPLTQFVDENGEIVDANGVKAYDTVTDKVFKAIAEAGINGISYIPSVYREDDKVTTLRTLEYASKYGIGVTVNMGVSDDVTDVKFAELLGKFSHYTAFKGLFIKDEPSTAQLVELSARSVKSNKFVNTFGYTNLLPTYAKAEAVPDYEAYIDEYCSTFGSKMISWDHYVFDMKDKSKYFNNMSMVKDAAEKYNIPFWGFLQTGDSHGREAVNSQGVNPTVVTTKSQMLWNLNTQLAYGAKGMQYFTLVQPNGYSYSNTESPEFDYNAGGIIGANGEKTQYYDHAVAANKQIAAVDHILMNSDSLAMLAKGTNAESHTGLTSKTYGSLTNITVGNSAQGTIVGCFDYRGNQAFYIVNYDMDNAQNITVSFDKAYSYSTYAASGENAGKGNSYTAALGAGEAVLIVLG